MVDNLIHCLARAPILAYVGGMAGTAHDVLVTALRDRPALLAKLVKLVARRSIEKPVAALDSTVRAPRSIEVRPI